MNNTIKSNDKLDINQHGEEWVISVTDYTRATIQATNPLGGAWSNAVVAVEKSIDGRTFEALTASSGGFGGESTPVTITEAGITEIDVEGEAFIRFRLSTLEGTDNTISVSIYMYDTTGGA